MKKENRDLFEALEKNYNYFCASTQEILDKLEENVHDVNRFNEILKEV